LSFGFKRLEHRVGIEPTYTGFADLRVSHFATDACEAGISEQEKGTRVENGKSANEISLDPFSDSAIHVFKFLIQNF
jgi:hypothetical protein